MSIHYPITEKYLGIEPFKNLCLAYINQHPSTYYSIRWFGDTFSAFIRESHSDTFLPELTEWEWTLTLAFDAADSDPLQLTALKNISSEKWPYMRFQLHPSANRLNFIFNTVEIWQAISEQHTPPAIKTNPTPLHWIIWRKGLETQYCSLSNEEACAIDYVLDNKNFGEVCEDLSQWFADDRAINYAAELLNSWLNAGLVARVSTP